MINILLTYRNEQFIKLRVYGHAMYGISGSDIVCAAISTLVQSVIIGLEEVISRDFKYCIDEDKARVSLDISGYSDENKCKAQILFKAFRYTVDKLLLDYRQYIDMKVEEE